MMPGPTCFPLPFYVPRLPDNFRSIFNFRLTIRRVLRLTRSCPFFVSVFLTFQLFYLPTSQLLHYQRWLIHLLRSTSGFLISVVHSLRPGFRFSLVGFVCLTFQLFNFLTFQLFYWWRMGDSNPRPRRCERRALPAELIPHAVRLPDGRGDEGATIT